MASVNKKTKVDPIFTAEGGRSSRISKIEELRRTVLASLLWEDNFYEDGVSVSERVKSLLDSVSEDEAKKVLFEAKFEQKLRHMPLYLLTLFASKGWLKKEEVEKICTRVDDMTELLALYWKDGKCPIDKQLRKGLQKAFRKFDAYALGKYNRDKDIRLADIIKLVHPRPLDDDQAKLWKKILDDKLESPDTWEVALSKGANKKETFERLINEDKLGDLAFIRNLRKMNEVGVDKDVIKKYFNTRTWKWILPFQFVTSARYNPIFEPELEKAMLQCLGDMEKIEGKVKLLVDVSGSMKQVVSSKSEATRIDVAAGLAILLREICPNIEVYTFDGNSRLVPARHGFALRDSIGRAEGGSTYMWKAVKKIGQDSSDLMVVITDEQTSDNGKVEDSNSKLLTIINVASNKNGVGYGKGSLHINGWSENVVVYLQKYLKEFNY